MLCSHETKELFSAISENKADKVEYWLKKGADTNAINSLAETPLIVATKQARWNALKMLVKHSKEKIPTEVLHETIMYQEEIAQLIIEKGCDFEKQSDSRGQYPLHTAIIYEKVHLIKLLLEHGANPAIKSEAKVGKTELTPLQYALQRKVDIVIVKLLLDALINKNIKFEVDTELENAAKFNNWDYVKLFISHPKYQLAASVSDNLLLYAVNQNKEDIFHLLKEKKASLNRYYFPDKGYYPLHTAVNNNNIRMVGLLLEAKADPFMKSVAANESKLPSVTSFDIAINNGHKEMINFLLEKTGQKDKKMDEILSSVTSYRTASAKMNECLDKYKLMPEHVLQYIQKKPKDVNAHLLILTFFQYMINKKNLTFVEMFKDIQFKGHDYVAEAIIDVITDVSESNPKFNKAIPALTQTLLKPVEMDTKHAETCLSSNELTELQLLKNKYVKTLRDKVRDIQDLNFDKKIIQQIAAIHDIEDNLYANTYDPEKIENKLKLIYGKDIFSGSFFYKNPLLLLIKQINLSLKTQNQAVSPALNAPPKYNPESEKMENEQPGLAPNNSYLKMNLFQEKLEIEEEQIEGLQMGREINL